MKEQKLGVYVCRDDTGLIKIGSTANLQRRLYDIRHRHGNVAAHRVVLELWITTKLARWVEYQLHGRLSPYCAHGEWYRLDDRMIRLLPHIIKDIVRSAPLLASRWPIYRGRNSNGRLLFSRPYPLGLLTMRKQRRK